jgi:hypothetical protein
MADKKREARGCFKPKCSPEKLAKAVEELINDYLENGIVPTDFRLSEKTGVSKKTQERWYDGVYDEGEERGYQESMSRLVEFRSQICVENGANGASNKSTFWIYLSKQKLWGGFQDSIQRTETKGSQDIKITIAGADGKPLKNGK